MRAAIAVILAAVLPACADAQESKGTGVNEPNTLTAEEKAAGWRLLFDGKTTNGWRAYNGTGMPDGWQVVDGALTRVAPAADIITTEKFRDFELSLEWKVQAGGNSGIFYRAVEGLDYIFQGAPEYQVLDDERHADGKSELTSAGSNYALHRAPRGVVRPAGQWNEARIVVKGNHVEHWLNGRKIVDYELGSDAWKQLVARSKFANWKQYGLAAEGHIGLQEHGDFVAFRNIKIRPV